MSDTSSASAPAPVAAKAATTWADVANTAAHYIAGGAIVALVGFFFYQGKVSQDLFVLTVTGAAAVVGIKLK